MQRFCGVSGSAPAHLEEASCFHVQRRASSARQQLRPSARPAEQLQAAEREQARCTLYHAPRTMLYAPCTVHRTPRTMHHAPFTVHHAPRTIHRAPCTTHHSPHTPCTTHHAHVPCTMHRVLVLSFATHPARHANTRAGEKTLRRCVVPASHLPSSSSTSSTRPLSPSTSTATAQSQ